MTDETPESGRTTGDAAGGDLRADGGDVPLNIAGHEDEKRERGASGADDPFGDSGDDRDEPSDDAILDDDIDVETGADDDEAEPVELLVQLAEESEIEPWDIDIVAVTDKFLDRLDEVDLRTSGRALFYASVLLRMKSDAMLSDDEDDEPDEEAAWDDWDAPMAEDGELPAHDPVAKLEGEMERRLDRKTARGTPETLDQLVRELRERERDSWWKDSRSYDTSDSPGGFQRGTQTLDYRTDDAMRVEDEPSEDEALGNAHEEDIEAVIDDVREELRTHYEAGRDEVLYAEIDEIGGSRIQTFLALLFLSHRGIVTLEQDDLFGDLWVADAEAADESEPPEAIAD